MSRVCEVTGKRVTVGNTVSHSNIKTKRKFYPNLQTKKFYVAETDSYITLKVSAKGLKTITKNGVIATLQKAKEKGFIK